MEYLIIIIAILAFGGVIFWLVKYTQKVNARKLKLFKDFAQKHNLTHTTAKFMFTKLNEVSGEMAGCHFHFYERMQGSGKNQRLVSYVLFSNSPFNFDFKIGKEHIFSKAGKMIGMKDIEFDDAEFDASFLIKSKSENLMRDLITYDIQNMLKDLKSDLKSSIENKNGVLSYSVYGGLPNEKTFVSNQKVIDFMVKLIQKKNGRW